jgi:two-component system, chemotaxis family, chemotaxis protein CheY
MAKDSLEDTKIILADELDKPYVLVVDDNQSAREYIIDMLQDMGFSKFEEAENGKEAMVKLRQSRACIIISDQNMKDMTGLELLSEIRNYPYLADIPFLMISSNSEMKLVDSSFKLGAMDFILKPVDFNTLEQKIKRVLKLYNEDMSF